jgi:tRNA(fMet)-specific endonuclease VapC
MDAALIDTDILNEVLKQRNPQVIQNAAAYLAQHRRFTISAFTRYEILRGLKEINATAQLTRLATFCQHASVLPILDSTLDRASELWAAARRGGHPAHDADLVIAATALENGLALVTGNTVHFAWIPGLRMENWRQP